ncbi:putative Calcium-binding EF-hand family protein [Hibiscus syriacus]|uniref:Calcium-binding EF-hand family protein n=1 Tax=Hibiscus syriacus TaxID=106335 RepID=A0A6A2ZRK5_HIBSY|nr:putative Calcium-binding EF-hand family protein [Hibiscus syriacus]
MAAQSGRSNEHVVINVQSSLVSFLNVELRDDCLSMPHSCCIFNIPSILFRHNESSFLPNCFSIGPMHRGKEHLVAVEKIKKYLKGLLCRVIKARSEESKENEEEKVLSDFVNAVKLIEKQASACYAGHNFAAELGDEFVKTMLLDGVFVIELLRRGAEEVKEPDDPIFSMSCMLHYLHHDLILLENQIPWLVLEILFEKTRLPRETKFLVELALSFFANTFTSDSPETSCFREKKKISSIFLIYFKKGKADSVLDIKFKDGCVEIPPLLIQETTETIFRNLIVYEQCLLHCPPIFTCYAMFLDDLINTNDDMEILCKHDIFDNWLGWKIQPKGGGLDGEQP